MSAKSISFNGYSLQDANWKTKDILYRNLPIKNIDIHLKSRDDGFNVVNVYYSEKLITIEGAVSDISESALKTKIDLMKTSLSVNEANLDINDGGTTMRYVCSVKTINIPEKHYDITRLPYQIVFQCQPFGMLTTQTTDTNSISASPFNDTLDPTGSAKPKAILKWTCNGAPTSAITAISFENETTNETITITGLSLDANGDYLIIDCDEMTVKRSYDGGAETEIDFTGIFPSFLSTSNSYKVSVTGGGASWLLLQEIAYYPSYL